MDFLDFNTTYSDTLNFNTKVKIYPNGKKVVYYCNSSIFCQPSEAEEDFDNALDSLLDMLVDNEESEADMLIRDLIEQAQKNGILELLDKEKEEANREKNIARCIRRAKDRIFDIAFCNDWKYFVTLTIDDEKINAFNVKDVMKKLNKILNNMQQRHGLSYIIIPEFHESGRVHCHGLINDALKVEDSGTRGVNGYTKPLKLSTIKAKGLMKDVTHVIYNLPQWTYGFSTAVPVYGDGGALATYVTKYMTKSTTKIFGKYYWSSRDLMRQPKIEYKNTQYQDIDLQEYRIPNTSIKLKYESRVEFTKE